MNKKIILPLGIVIMVLLLGGIAYSVLSRQVTVDEEGGVTTKKDTVVTQEASYVKDGNTFKFTKNRVTRTAEVDVEYGIADSEEYVDFLGEQVTMAPFFVNLICSTFNAALFDPESLKEASESAATEDQPDDVTQDEEFKNALEGYKVANFQMNFVDAESKEKIADCESSQKGFESIKFAAHRDYTQTSSMFGHQIGVLPKE